MVEDRPQVLAQLRRMPLFSPLTSPQLNAVVDRFESITLEEGEALFINREPEENYYILVSGQLTVHPGLGGEQAPKKLLPGESFDEETLLYGYPPTALILADQRSGLLRLDSEAFDRLPAEFPAIKPCLGRTEETRRLVSRLDFEWLRPDEVIYYLARKHEVIFIYTLLGPVLVFLIATVLAFYFSFNEEVSSTVWTGATVVAAILAIGSILWGVWNWIDWGNDFYIVTDQRVVWVEKVIWLYESRDEAPHNTILSVDVNTTLLGRAIHYGSVIVRTFTGQIIFRNVKKPYQMARFIDEYRFRARRHSERIEKSKLNQAIRQRIGGADGVPEAPIVSPPLSAPPPPRLNFWRRHFGNFFAMRFEQGEVITYRKYWPTLLGHVAVPSLLILLLWMGMAFLVNSYRLGEIPLSWLETLLGLCLALFVLVLVPWWLYQYVDWRNDIYQITDKFIFDISRKPLGTEEKKSAPLENILTLEHERLGFLGYLLNFGNVLITVGGAKFTFDNVHDPARVQQDIFDRMYALRRTKEQEETSRQRERLVDVIEIYHHNQAEQNQEEDSNEYEDEYESDDY